MERKTGKEILIRELEQRSEGAKTVWIAIAGWPHEQDDIIGVFRAKGDAIAALEKESHYAHYVAKEFAVR